MIIGLLGPSQAGKTAYLTRLYGMITKTLSRSGYGIDFTIDSLELQTRLEDLYTDLVNQGKFGDGTSEITEYPIVLKGRDADGSIKQIDVTIVDFPGEMLHRSDPAAIEERKRIIAGLSACDGFIVLLDGQVLLDGTKNNNPEQLQNKLKADAVSAVLEEALEIRRKNSKAISMRPDDHAFGTGKTPIAFIVTKGDMIERHLLRGGKDNIDDTDLKVAISGLFNINAATGGAPAKGERTIGNFIRSQYGRIIDSSDVASARMQVSVYDQVGKRICDQNVAAPFQFVLFGGLINARAEYKARSDYWLGINTDSHTALKKLEERKESLRAEHKKDTAAYQKVLDDRNIIETLWYNIAIEPREDRFKRHAVTLGDMDISRIEKGLETVRGRINESHQKFQAILPYRQSIDLFLPRALSDEVVYNVSYGQNLQEQYFVRGFPIPDFKGEPWWGQKWVRWQAHLEKLRLTPEEKPKFDWD